MLKKQKQKQKNTTLSLVHVLFKGEELSVIVTKHCKKELWM
jgi:hypothetical protein